jgi:hypothetical protein
MMGGLFSVIWCFVALFLSMVRKTPNTSLFPDIDFAAKFTRQRSALSVYPRSQPSETFPDLLSELTNATSYEIRKRLARAKLYVRVATSDVERDRVLRMTDDGDEGLAVCFKANLGEIWRSSGANGYQPDVSFHQRR